MDGYDYIWDRFMWLTLGYRQPVFYPSCWKQKIHSKQNQPNYTRNMEQISLELCNHSVILKDSY